jgi:ATP-dependent exoDNAse (exonuclease V) alpha subunit
MTLVRPLFRRTAFLLRSPSKPSAEKENLVTVKRETGEQVSYDPRRLHGVTLYRETERAFSVGDRVQFTAPNRERHIANRELGIIEKIDDSGLQLRLDSGRTVAFNTKENPHLDYGYAVTSHSSQGQTADRVLIHVDTEQAGEKLVNQRLAYVSISRGRLTFPPKSAHEDI